MKKSFNNMGHKFLFAEYKNNKSLVYCILSMFNAFVTKFLGDLYSVVHWQILQDQYVAVQDNHDLREALFDILNGLEIYRVFGVISAFYLVLAFSTPKISWMVLPAIPCALFAVFISCVMM